ncbi:hypothetical protein STVA_53660 [Allostella vacuolata]|nr:hypothetical protein STVA_53660 [Stella vacuolata]
MIEILRAADRHPIPWKNGGGQAEDIASAPPAASWDAMDWRVSRAWITASGPFSIFPGIDRTFLVADGDGVVLSPAGMAAAALDLSSPPFVFAGDVATGCRLAAGPTIAFNVMSARGRWHHRVTRHEPSGAFELAATAPGTLAVLLRGRARLQGHGKPALAAGDAVRLSAGATLALAAEPHASIAWVELWRAAT